MGGSRGRLMLCSEACNGGTWRPEMLRYNRQIIPARLRFLKEQALKDARITGSGRAGRTRLRGERSIWPALASGN